MKLVREAEAKVGQSGAVGQKKGKKQSRAGGNTQPSPQERLLEMTLDIFRKLRSASGRFTESRTVIAVHAFVTRTSGGEKYPI